MTRRISRLFTAAAFAGALAIGSPFAAAAQETQSKQPSDRTVDFLKTFVEGFLIPEELPLPDGTKIKVDRAKKDDMKKFEIPRDDMRRIIRIAYSGANAEICKRTDLQEKAYKWLKDEEYAKKKWSNQQMFFISRLFVATVMWQTGQAQVVVEEKKPGDKDTETVAVGDKKDVVCTDAKKEGVKQLEAFLADKKG